MKLFKPRSIKNKLIGIILLVSVFAIISGFTIVIITNFRSFKSDMLNSTIIKAKLISEYCIAPLVFQDSGLSTSYLIFNIAKIVNPLGGSH